MEFYQTGFLSKLFEVSYLYFKLKNGWWEISQCVLCTQMGKMPNVEMVEESTTNGFKRHNINCILDFLLYKFKLYYDVGGFYTKNWMARYRLKELILLDLMECNLSHIKWRNELQMAAVPFRLTRLTRTFHIRSLT